MNKLDAESRSQILHMLCEGQSIRAIVRVTGLSKNTVAKLLVDAGKACEAYHGEHVRDIQANLVQCDEIWSFACAEQESGVLAKGTPDGADGMWTWTALDADSKLIVSYFVGGRDGECAMMFMNDIASRLFTRVQVTTDGHKAYLEAVEGAFGCDVDYSQLVKLYGNAPESSKGHYSLAERAGIKKARVEGNSDPAYVPIFNVEYQNLTMRMHMSRFNSLTNAFSKKVENHLHAIALHVMHYNFIRIHETLRMTPAMAAGITDKLWEIRDVVALIEAKEAKKSVQ
ncbi:UNVERIFIED_ORG: IS1 family transposase [Roseateles sp. XES5]|nr:IS1 family transposase [Roseateles sp. XES5]